MSPNNPSTPTGVPEGLPNDRGTVDRINRVLLTPQLRHVLKDGDLKESDFSEWPGKPWMAYEFLASRVSRIGESVDANPDKVKVKAMVSGTMSIDIHDKKIVDDIFDYYRDLFGQDTLTTLKDWHAAAMTDSKEREKWENKNPLRVQQAKKAVGSLHSALGQKVKTFEATSKNLRGSKDMNMVENVLRGTKEYVWDELREHPEMSIGLVVLSYFAFKKVKGTRLGTFLGLAAGATVAGAFLKDKFGVQPTEKMAEIAERMGLTQVADGIRDVRDTGMRALFGAEGEGTINGYFYKKLEFHRTNERIAFNFLLKQNPKEFMEWYDAAAQWRMGDDKRPPGNVTSLVYKVSRGGNIPSQFKNMPIAERAELLIRISETVFGHISDQNGEGKDVKNGISIVRERYIDGMYFDVLWNRFENQLSGYEKRYTDPAILKQIDRVRKEAKEFCKGMGKRVQRGSDQIQFMDILYVENGDNDEIDKFVGPGWTQDQISTFMGDQYEKLKDLMEDMKDKAVDLGKDAKDYVTGTVPEYWEKTGWPAIVAAWEYAGDFVWEDDTGKAGPAKIVYKYLTEETILGDPESTRLKLAIKKARETGSKTIEIAIDNPIADLLKEMGIQAGNAIIMTLEQAEKMAEWMETQKIGGLSIIPNTTADQFDLVINKPIPGYKYTLSEIELVAADSVAGLSPAKSIPEKFITATSGSMPITFQLRLSLATGQRHVSGKAKLMVEDRNGDEVGTYERTMEMP
jgi:hypothetical protein